jgi:predicted double-glycine peptidase
MNPNWLGLGTVAGALLLAWWVEPKLRLRSRLLRWGALAVGFLLSVPALWISLYYTHLVPETEFFYEMRAARFSELLQLPVALFAASWLSLISSRMHGYLLMFVVGGLLLPWLKPIVVPLSESQRMTRRAEPGVVLQTYPSTCGPACVCNILLRHGLAADEREVAAACHTYQGGTEAWYLARYLRERGIDAKFRFTDWPEQEVRLPAIFGVMQGRFGHFIVVLSAKDGQVDCINPAGGRWTGPLDRFLRTHRLTRFHLEAAR